MHSQFPAVQPSRSILIHVSSVSDIDIKFHPFYRNTLTPDRYVLCALRVLARKQLRTGPQASLRVPRAASGWLQAPTDVVSNHSGNQPIPCFPRRPQTLPNLESGWPWLNHPQHMSSRSCPAMAFTSHEGVLRPSRPALCFLDTL